MNRWMIKAKHSFSMFRHFRSPALTFLVRLGFLKVDYCSYRLRKNGYSYGLLGRPLGGDHRIIREVLIDETYAPILPILPNKPLRALDIGAHIGSFMIWLSAHKTVGRFLQSLPFQSRTAGKCSSDQNSLGGQDPTQRNLYRSRSPRPQHDYRRNGSPRQYSGCRYHDFVAGGLDG